MTPLRFNGDRFGTRLRRWRGNRTLRAAARELGSSASTLSRLESGGVPELELFMTLCAALDADPRSFFYVADGA